MMSGKVKAERGRRKSDARTRLGTRARTLSVLAVGIILTAEAVLSSWFSGRSHVAEFEQDAQTLTDTVAQSLSFPLWDYDLEILEDMSAAIVGNPIVTSAVVTEMDGKRMASASGTSGIVTDLSFTRTIQSHANGMPLGQVELGFSSQSLRAELRTELFIALMLALAITTLVAAVFAVLLRSVVKPIQELSNSVSNYDGRDLESLGEVFYRHDEVGDLARGFADMADAIGDNVRTLESRVTERTSQLELAVESASAASAAKSAFLATMSHEIRTPMNGVLGMAQILQCTDLTEDQDTYVRIMRESGMALMTILNDILDFSKIEAGHLTFDPVPFSLREAVGDVASLLGMSASDKGVALHVDISPDLPERLVGDAGRIRQILTNLMGNALKFTDVGRVDVGVQVRLRDGGKTAALALSVRDTGIGIPDDKLAAIFDEFTQAEQSTTRRFGGTGLGLSITRGIVDAMGGTLRVGSEVGVGSVFVVDLTLPVATVADANPAADANPKTSPTAGRTSRARTASAPTPTQEPPAQEPPAQERARERILVADDNPNNIAVLEQLLFLRGAVVETAANGREAVEMATTRHYDAVLMDISMPVMNGMEATQAVREHAVRHGRARVPVIAVTAHVMNGDQQAFLAAGMDDYLPKPLTMDALNACLARWVVSGPESGKAQAA